MSRYSPTLIDRFHRRSRVYLTIISILFYAGALAPKDADADLISVRSIGGDVGNSEMFLSHQLGGELGFDSGDSTVWPDRPPAPGGGSENWLRIYSDQWNQYYNIEGSNLRTDNRPFHLERGEEEFNQPFPLVLDTRYGNNEPSPAPITSSNNFVRFELQLGPDVDQGRQFYNWTMTIDPTAGASWADGFSGNTRSGSIDWLALGGQGSTADLPAYNLTDTQGQYATLLVTPIPEPSSVILLILGAGGVFVARHLRSRKLLG